MPVQRHFSMGFPLAAENSCPFGEEVFPDRFARVWYLEEVQTVFLAVTSG
jgi:hypothetical protein